MNNAVACKVSTFFLSLYTLQASVLSVKNNCTNFDLNPCDFISCFISSIFHIHIGFIERSAGCLNNNNITYIELGYVPEKKHQILCRSLPRTHSPLLENISGN